MSDSDYDSDYDLEPSIKQYQEQQWEDLGPWLCQFYGTRPMSEVMLIMMAMMMLGAMMVHVRDDEGRLR